MSKKSAFIKYVEEMIEATKDTIPVSEDADLYWETFKGKDDGEKPAFTDNGKLILNYLREHQADMPSGKAKDIADGMLVSSRMVSGAIRKLITDGYVEKISQDPVVYALTDLGKTVEII